MFAFSIPNLRYSLPAGGAVNINRFISVTTSSTAVQATDTTSVIGASSNAVETDKGVAADQQIVEIHDGIVPVESGGIVPAGSKVKSDSEGRAIIVGVDEIGVGTAITESTASGQIITIKFNQ